MNGLRALCLSFLLLPVGVWAQTLRLVGRGCEKTLAYCDRLQTPAAGVALREKQGHLAH
jgi:hypothetical protein